MLPRFTNLLSSIAVEMENPSREVHETSDAQSDSLLTQRPEFRTENGNNMEDGLLVELESTYFKPDAVFVVQHHYRGLLTMLLLTHVM